MPQLPLTVTYAQAYLPYFHAYQDELLRRLEILVNIDSGTGQVEGINHIMTYLEEWLREIDFSVTLYPDSAFGTNLLARRKGTGKARILLVGHVDTVYAPGAAQECPFTLRDGRAYGPGVIDMKSGVVMGIYALRALAEQGFDRYGDIHVLFNNDEETGSTGSAPLLRAVAQQVDVGLVLEGSKAADVLTHARKGADKYTLEVSGVSAHSGVEPQNGRSAVIELAHKMIAIHNLNTLFHGVTFNVTRISSSEPLNIVPDAARCHISVRAFTDAGLRRAAAALEQIAAGCSVPDTHSILTRIPGRRPYEATPQVQRLVAMAQAEGAALGLDIVSERKGGASDANLLMEFGIPTLDSLGPVGGGPHNLSREYLVVDSLPLRGALLAGLLQRISLSESTLQYPQSGSKQQDRCAPPPPALAEKRIPAKSEDVN
jgi:glutamate carboxypeptidase